MGRGLVNQHPGGLSLVGVTTSRPSTAFSAFVGSPAGIHRTRTFASPSSALLSASVVVASQQRRETYDSQPT